MLYARCGKPYGAVHIIVAGPNGATDRYLCDQSRRRSGRGWTMVTDPGSDLCKNCARILRREPDDSGGAVMTFQAFHGPAVVARGAAIRGT